MTSKATLQRPTALSEDTDEPLDLAWGRALALGAAITYLADQEGDTIRLAELIAARNDELSLIRRKQMLQQENAIQRYW